MNDSQEELAAEILAYANKHNIKPNQAITTYINDGRVKGPKDKRKILGIIGVLVREMNKHDIKGESPKSIQKIDEIDEDLNEDEKDNEEYNDEAGEGEEEAHQEKEVTITKPKTIKKHKEGLPDNLPDMFYEEEVKETPITLKLKKHEPIYETVEVDEPQFITNPNYKQPTQQVTYTQTPTYISQSTPQYTLKQSIQEPPTHKQVAPTSYPGDAKDIMNQAVNKALNKSYSAAFETISEKIFVDTYRRAQFEAWAAAYNYPDDLGTFLVDCFDEFMELRGIELEIVIRNRIMK